MSLQKLIINYAQSNLWSNQTYVEWLQSKPSELLKTVVPSSFPTILMTLDHIAGTEDFWSDVITCTSHQKEWERISKELDAEAVFEDFLTKSARFLEVVTSLSASELEEEVLFLSPWISGHLPRYQFIQHALNHSTYHRGQIVTMGRNLGITDAPMTDYNFFNMIVENKATPVLA